MKCLTATTTTTPSNSRFSTLTAELERKGLKTAEGHYRNSNNIQISYSKVDLNGASDNESM